VRGLAVGAAARLQQDRTRRRVILAARLFPTHSTSVLLVSCTASCWLYSARFSGNHANVKSPPAVVCHNYTLQRAGVADRGALVYQRCMYRLK